MNSDINLEKINSTSVIDETSEINIFAQYRRLKIQENLLRQELNKSVNKYKDITNNVTEDEILLYPKDLTSKNFLNNLKDSYFEIDELFTTFKSNITIEENLEEIDLNEVKTEVLTLDSKIMKLKELIEAELNSLKLNQKDLERQVKENNVKCEKFKAFPRVKIKTYNASVQSPTKAIIQSPYKCQEVQKFQDFMKESQNRYGGWNEYNHNIFTRIWKKYFDLDETCDLSTSIMEHDKFNLFLNEVAEKLIGMKTNNIIDHTQWFVKFTYLKEEQRKALISWRKNRSIIKKFKGNLKSQRETPLKKESQNIFGTSLSSSIDADTCLESSSNKDDVSSLYSDFEENRFISEDVKCNPKEKEKSGKIESREEFYKRISQPKEKALKECIDKELFNFQPNSIDTVEKYRVPFWRQGIVLD